MYKRSGLGYNSYPMAATRATATGFASSRKGQRGYRPILIVLGFVVCFLVANGIVGEHGAVAVLRARAQNAELSQSVSRLRAENERLREERRRLESDPAAIEEIARRELGLLKPGEKLFIIKDVPARE